MAESLPNSLPKSLVSNSLPDIDAVNVYADAEQSRVLPRQVGTGNTRGQQQLYGSLIIRDENDVVRMIAGFSEGAF